VCHCHCHYRLIETLIISAVLGIVILAGGYVPMAWYSLVIVLVVCFVSIFVSRHQMHKQALLPQQAQRVP
jgi:hypothetical protein